MAKTHLTIEGEKFLINEKVTYSDIDRTNPAAHGLLLNARFIQGIFDDAMAPDRFARWGHGEWDPLDNTERLIAALPEWYRYGLRAFTTGFQGGGPCFTVPNHTIQNNPFGADGLNLDADYAERMDKLIRGADAVGMIVIVSFFYGSQTRWLKDEKAIRNAVTTASRFVKEYPNVIIEVANEMNIGAFANHPIIQEPEGMVTLLNLARKESGGLPCGCSGGGGYRNREVAEASDVILIHGNGCTRQRYHNMIREVQSWNLNRPIVCNEDSQAIGQLQVAYKTQTSWGYYNNMTKQEPPADWGITTGEDTFFAHRMAEGIGIATDPIADQYYLQGLEPHWEYRGQRWLRLASLYPETISYVDFYRNGKYYDTAYDEPFSLHFQTNWRQGGIDVRDDDREWKAVIHCGDGHVIEKTVQC
ncbi:MAG: hypothetical protein OXG87_02080 [Gemmatimonadetes bacterium]|nr:hypothetical protein [Gemmatimonadota bacterium]